MQTETTTAVAEIPAPAAQHTYRKQGADGRVYATANVYIDGTNHGAVHLVVDVTPPAGLDRLPDQTIRFRAKREVSRYAHEIAAQQTGGLVETASFPCHVVGDVEESHRFTVRVSTRYGRQAARERAAA